MIKRYQKLARIPGFRAGKVPESLVRTKFAKELRQEVLESLVSERFRTAITERKLQPVSEPQLLDLQLTDGAAAALQGGVRGAAGVRRDGLRDGARGEAARPS